MQHSYCEMKKIKEIKESPSGKTNYQTNGKKQQKNKPQTK